MIGSAGGAPAAALPDGAVADGEFPADPYPGVVPPWSFVHLDGHSHALAPDPAALGGWRVGAGDDGLDAWLVRHGAEPTARRVPVLTFGSNRCPSKITWLRERLGLVGPVVVLRARVHDLAAVWAAGRRARDGARPATLALTPGAVEVHAVWMATPEQVAVLDACEGRGERYDLVRLHAGRVVTEDGALVDAPWTYWPAAPERAPLLVDGVPVRCSELHHDRARDLEGEAAPVAVGDAVSPQVGPPDPESWPPRLFAYGTLQPGRRAWSMLEPHTRGAGADPWSASMPGRVLDTGRGFPALTLTGAADDTATGTVVTLPAIAGALPALDEYEGPEYRRVRAVAHADGRAPGAPGTVCWVWVWIDEIDADGWPVVRGSWGGPTPP